MITESIEKLNYQFDNVTVARNDILDIFSQLNVNIKLINKIYVDVVKQHNQKEYLFGLDSFHFQNKMIEMEYENMRKVFNCIDNHMYSEYYKLYKFIQDYIVNDIKYNKIIEKNIFNKFPVYKDLEPEKTYDFEITKEIHSIVITIIIDLYEYLNEKTHKMIDDKDHISKGFNIDNIINRQRFTNSLLNERINMYINYLDVISKHYHKYISRLILKCKLMLDIFNEDVQIKQKQVNNKKEDEETIVVIENTSVVKNTDRIENTDKVENTSVVKNTDKVENTDIQDENITLTIIDKNKIETEINDITNSNTVNDGETNQ